MNELHSLAHNLVGGTRDSQTLPSRSPSLPFPILYSGWRERVSVQFEEGKRGEQGNCSMVQYSAVQWCATRLIVRPYKAPVRETWEKWGIVFSWYKLKQTLENPNEKSVCGCMRVIQRVRVLWRPIIYMVKTKVNVYVLCSMFHKAHMCHNKGTQMCHLSFFHVQLKCTSSEHIRIFHEFMPITWKHMKADTYMCKLYCDKYVLQYKHFLGCNERFLFLLFSMACKWLKEIGILTLQHPSVPRKSRIERLVSPTFSDFCLLECCNCTHSKMLACKHAHMHMDAHR